MALRKVAWVFDTSKVSGVTAASRLARAERTEGQKALYMGYANMPTAIGWAYGSLLAGDLYDRMGDKANLALRYLGEHGAAVTGVTRTDAMVASVIRVTVSLNRAAVQLARESGEEQ